MLGCSGPAGTPTAPEPVKHSGMRGGGGGEGGGQYFTRLLLGNRDISVHELRLFANPPSIEPSVLKHAAR